MTYIIIKKLKNKLKIIVVIMASVIIVSELSVYATYNYFARDISYDQGERLLDQIYFLRTKD